MCLCREYTFRYGKIHKTQEVILDLTDNLPIIPDEGFTVPAQAMPDKYKTEPSDFVEAYRAYYNGEKRHIFHWKNRPCPDWVVMDK
jgi:hypothetical protein